MLMSLKSTNSFLFGVLALTAECCYYLLSAWCSFGYWTIYLLFSIIFGTGSVRSKGRQQQRECQ